MKDMSKHDTTRPVSLSVELIFHDDTPYGRSDQLHELRKGVGESHLPKHLRQELYLCQVNSTVATLLAVSE